MAPRDTVALPSRALAVVRGLPDHTLIDRLVRGRAWIPVLGVLLVGIVAMQVEILKLGSTMGRAMERSSVLQTQNESLQASVAGLADDQRIEGLAAGMGMSMPTPDSLVFLSKPPGGDVGRALANIHAPDPSGFIAQLAAQAAAAAALMPAPPATTSGAAATIGTVGASTSPGTSTTSAPATTSTAPVGTAGTTVTAPASTPATAPAATGVATTGVATNGVAPSGVATSGAAAGAGTSSGAGSSSGGGASASGAAAMAPAGSSQSGGTTGG